MEGEGTAKAMPENEASRRHVQKMRCIRFKLYGLGVFGTLPLTAQYGRSESNMRLSSEYATSAVSSSCPVGQLGAGSNSGMGGLFHMGFLSLVIGYKACLCQVQLQKLRVVSIRQIAGCGVRPDWQVVADALGSAPFGEGMSFPAILPQDTSYE